MVDAKDLKSFGVIRAGSSPALGTIIHLAVAASGLTHRLECMRSAVNRENFRVYTSGQSKSKYFQIFLCINHSKIALYYNTFYMIVVASFCFARKSLDCVDCLE